MRHAWRWRRQSGAAGHTRALKGWHSCCAACALTQQAAPREPNCRQGHADNSSDTSAAAVTADAPVGGGCALGKEVTQPATRGTAYGGWGELQADYSADNTT